MESGSFFVLDIGTRFVRGLICRPVPADTARPGAAVRITDCEILEHESRAMLAGQIHNIDKVAGIVRRVKEALETRNGDMRPLTKAAVAVAGRNLITRQGFSEAVRSVSSPITSEDVKQLELAAVQNALEELHCAGDSCVPGGPDAAEYCCVGYSAVEYRLDGADIKNLLDHRGTKIYAKVLVTLLPHQCLEAFFSVMKKVELEVSYLTLEPIAALEAAVPENLRSLNLALIDIGAGTSDIAVVSQGKVIGYGMVPAAGDSLTETLCGEYLVDFNEAERIKTLERERGTPVVFRDMFNREQTRPSGEILEKLHPAAKSMSARICGEISGLTSGKTENYAVVLVGGGSLTPFLEEEVSSAMKISRERIGIRGAGLNREIDDLTGRLSGPEAATAVGIALSYIKRAGLSLVRLTLNGKRVTIATSEHVPDILSVLLSHGMSVKHIYGRPGLARTFTLNGTLQTIKGELPTPAVCTLNGEKVPLNTPVKEDDNIFFSPAVDGRDARKTIGDILPAAPVVTINGSGFPLPYKVTLSGLEAGPDTEVADRAEINYSAETSLGGILKKYRIGQGSPEEKTIKLDVNGECVALTSNKHVLLVNDAVTADPGLLINAGDRIESRLEGTRWTAKDVVCRPPAGKDLRTKINGEEFVFPGGRGKILLNGADAEMDAEIRDGDILRTVPGKDAEAVLVDIFRYISVNPQDQLGKRLKLLINGQESQFTSPLRDGSEINVLFEKI